MSKDSKTGTMHGPVLSVMEELFGNPKDFNATDGAVYNGVPGYKKGDAGKIDEVTFDNSGGFGDVKKAGG